MQSTNKASIFAMAALAMSDTHPILNEPSYLTVDSSDGQAEKKAESPRKKTKKEKARKKKRGY